MPITAKCFVSSAQNILSIPSAEEPDFRNAVSRAYYGAFHVAKDFCEQSLDLDIDNFGGSTHKKLSDILCQHIDQDKEKQRTINLIGARLAILHTLRIRADYHCDMLVIKKDADSQIKNVLELISKIESISTS